jgi:hypothetical protein
VQFHSKFVTFKSSCPANSDYKYITYVMKLKTKPVKNDEKERGGSKE